MARPQITFYPGKGQKQWLKEYSKNLGIKESELVKILVERERNLKWLQAVLRAPQSTAEKKLARKVVDCLNKSDC